MKLHLQIVKNKSKEYSSYILEPNHQSQIEIDDLDMVNIEFEQDEPVNSNDISLILGNTTFQFDDPIQIDSRFFYKINLNQIKEALPGYEVHVSNEFYKTASGNRRFSRLFLNEIGLSRIFISIEGIETFYAGINISSKKVSKDNYKIITEYLFYNGYFDSKYLYKTVISGSQSNLPNSLIEALRKMVQLLKDWKANVNKFSRDPIKSTSNKSIIRNYSNDEALGDESIDWLADNIENLLLTSASESNMIISKRFYRIENILIKEPTTIYDSYENRIIHGFVSNLLKILSDKESELVKTTSFRIKVSSFRDYLIACFNQLIYKHFKDAKAEIIAIKSFYEKYLPVSTPLFDHPKKIDGFYSKVHYRKVFELINFSRNIFSFDLNKNNFHLEIESFDKLFEVYCFYLIKDIVSLNYSKNTFKYDPGGADTRTNKLAGKYSIEFDKQNVILNLYYEHFPSTFEQFSYSSYKPDFILEFISKGNFYYIILDAKYKSYSSSALESDLSLLTLKYLHKIGLSGNVNGKILGLFPVSLAKLNNRKSIFKREFDLQGEKSIVPHIGNIELNPFSLDIRKNNFIEIINFALRIIG